MLQPSNNGMSGEAKTVRKTARLACVPFLYCNVWRSGIGLMARGRVAGRSGGMRTIGSARKLEIDTGVAVGLFGGFEVELADWNFAGMLVPDGNGVAAEEVVVDLLGGTAVFEDQDDGALGGRSGRGTGG